MGRAGVLDYSQVAVGVTAEEIVDLALANVGTAWAGIPASFVWGISNLAGLPFFDLENLTDGPANTFVTDGYDSPHWWDQNTHNDGWRTVWADTHEARVSELITHLQPGDIVRVYDNCNWHETNGPGKDGPNSHSFIVVSTTGGNIEVVDAWTGGAIGRHDFQDIVDEMAENGKFQSAYVSRIIDDFVADHVPPTLQGNGYGDWSGIGGDLAVASAPSASAAWVGGALELSFSYRIDNAGLLGAAASRTGIYLSADATITTADTLLALDDVAALGAGGFSIESGKVTLPGDLAAGTYYIGVVADQPGAIGELSEANNISPAVAVTVEAPFVSDLDVTSKPALKIVWAAAGGSYKLTYDITNHGTVGTTPASHAGIYLSTDSTITADDRLVAIDDVAALASGATSGEGGTFVLPGDVAAGNYYIGVIADHDNAIGETDEANNASKAVAITVVTNGADVVDATIGEKSWHGLGGKDTITGTMDRDALYGDGGRDTLIGKGANDTLIGGNGADQLRGGAGADFFQFNTVDEIGKLAGKRDVIVDWNAAKDYIDLRNIDAREPSAADNAFKFVAAEGSDFSGDKGELRWVTENNSGTSHDRTLVMGDVDGDGKADFILQIKGLHTMQTVDFLL